MDLDRERLLERMVQLTRDLVLIHRGVDRLSTAAAALRGLLVEEAGRGPLG